MNNFDIVIVGSGLGGLLCGYTLSKEGYNVCVLEKNSQLGGCLQNFGRDGHVFETGVHYIGSLGEGQILNQYFRYFELMDKLKLKKLDEDCFDKIHFGGKDYCYAQGFERFTDTMLSYFPSEKEAISKYVNKIQEVSIALNLMTLTEIDENSFDLEINNIIASNYIESITSNKDLQNVLAGTNPLYAGVKGKSPFSLHALINYSFIESAWRIENGSGEIARQLTKSIKGFGGTVRNNSEVNSFVFENDELKAVELINGEKIYAKNFISNVHPARTLELIESHKLKKAYRKRIESLENTVSNFTIYISLKEDTFPLLNHNYYYYGMDDVWSGGKYDTKDWPQLYLMMTPPSKHTTKFARSMIVMTYMRFDEVKKWEHTYVGDRGDDYLQFKQDQTERLLNLIYQKYPELKDCIQSVSSSTPLTYRDYTGTVEGSMYGILHDATKPLETMVSSRTKIPNLFLTGQNIKFHGVLGVTIGSIVTSSCLLGMNYIVNKVKDA